MLDSVLGMAALVTPGVNDVAGLGDGLLAPSGTLLNHAEKVRFVFLEAGVYLGGGLDIDFVETIHLSPGALRCGGPGSGSQLVHHGLDGLQRAE